MGHVRRRRTIVLVVLALAASVAALAFAFQGSEGIERAKHLLESFGNLLGSHGDPQAAAGLAAEIGRPASGEHPLTPVLRWARARRGDVARIHDYECTLVKRERVGTSIVGPQYLFLKLRQEPFSVYQRFLAPPEVRNREVIYSPVGTMASCWHTPPESSTTCSARWLSTPKGRWRWSTIVTRSPSWAFCVWSTN
jgi:hypothetical protein